MKRGLCLSFLFLAGCLAAADAPAPATAPRTNTPATPIPQAPDIAKNFLVERGFRVELVATEPLVTSPIAMTFDENGRLFVLERTGNPANPAGAMGRVRVLEDADGNGVFDGSAVYADNLINPTALICYGGGVFVACGGQVQYLKDTAFDGTADVHRDIFKSFGEATNGAGGQFVITSFAWGLDNRIHVTTAGQGGDVVSSSSPSQSVILTGGNFSFDPRNFKIAAESGSASAGICFDNRGRIIAANHEQPLQMVMCEARYAARNPAVEMPGAMQSLAGAETAGRRPLSADSIAIYRGSAFPMDYWGDLFAVDAARGVVHRAKLRPHGLELSVEDAPSQPGAEFLTVRDNSFQIVQILNGPDGALYLAGNASAAVVPGKANANPSLTPARGCIYRVVPVNFKQPKPPQMSRAVSDQLVLLLRPANGWLGDTAARLIYERQDRSAVVPLIKLLYDAQTLPLSRLHALHALDGLQVTADGRAARPLMEPHIIKALNDPDDRVREHAVLLSEKFISPEGAVSDPLWAQFVNLAGDPSPQVRYQLAFTLGQARHPGRGQLLAQILRTDPTDRWMRAALATSLDDGAAEMLDSLAGDANFRNLPGGGDFLRQLFRVIGEKNQPREVARALNDLQRIPEPQLAFTLARAFDNSLQRADSSLAAADSRGALRPLYDNATRVALDNNADEINRIEALRLLSNQAFVDPGMCVALLQEWPTLKPRLRREAVVSMLSRPGRTAGMLQGMVQDWLARSDLTSPQIRYLFTLRDPITQPRVTALYGNGPDNRSRQPLVNRFLPALQLAGRADLGRGIFLDRCAACHQVAGDGNAIGLSLAGAAKTDKEKLLAKIIDPNREPPENYPATLVETMAGETLTGFIAGETAKSITLCDANGVERVIGRSNISSRQALGFSAMPEGLEASLSQQDMADLLAFISGQP